AVMEDYSEDGLSVTEEECRAALAVCLAKGWLQILDEPALAKIAEELREGKFLGPIYGRLPEPGCVDFTTAGAELWQLLRRRCLPDNQEVSFAYEDLVHSRTARFFRTKASA